MLENKLDDILAKDDEENEGKWYYLDFFPVTFQAGNDKFDRFESFIQEKYYKSFSKKLSFIILGLVSYYDAEIYLYDVDYGDDWLNSLRHQKPIRIPGLEQAHQALLRDRNTWFKNCLAGL